MNETKYLREYDRSFVHRNFANEKIILQKYYDLTFFELQQSTRLRYLFTNQRTDVWNECEKQRNQRKKLEEAFRGGRWIRLHKEE